LQDSIWIQLAISLSVCHNSFKIFPHIVGCLYVVIASINHTCIPKLGVFRLHPERLNFSQALNSCRSSNSELAHVISEVRTTALSALVQQLGNSRGPKRAYVGLEDRKVEGRFTTTMGNWLLTTEVMPTLIHISAYFTVSRKDAREVFTIVWNWNTATLLVLIGLLLLDHEPSTIIMYQIGNYLYIHPSLYPVCAYLSTHTLYMYIYIYISFFFFLSVCLPMSVYVSEYL
jgi:hypothetical protein